MTDADDDIEQTQSLLGGAEHATAAHRVERAREYLATASNSARRSRKDLLALLYGHLPSADLPRVAWLSSTLSCIIGGFWLLDSLKDAVLERTVGLELQPAAKLLSVAVTLLLVIQYNRLVDRVRKHVLFYILGLAYTLLLLLVGLALGTDAVRKGEGGRAHGAWKGVGFASYVAIESYGSLTVALFWAFVNAAASLEEAKASYGLIIAGAQSLNFTLHKCVCTHHDQVGAIAGSTVATLAGGSASLSKLFMMGALSPACTAVMVFGYVHLFKDHLPRESDAVHAYRAAQHSIRNSSSNGVQRNGVHTAAVAANGVTEKTVPMFEGIHLVF
eukprot:9344-Heterococcus_DN1.PRE.2